MGMSASQARLLALQARQSNLEYQGQQINQERTILSQQCTALYNSLLAMTVPTPPSTSDFTSVKYTGENGATEYSFNANDIKPGSDGSYRVTLGTTEYGACLNKNAGYVTTSTGAETVYGKFVQRDDYGEFNTTEQHVGYKEGTGTPTGSTPYMKAVPGANVNIGQEVYVYENGEFTRVQMQEAMKNGNVYVVSTDGAYDPAKDKPMGNEITQEIKNDFKEYTIAEQALKNFYVFENGFIRVADPNKDFEKVAGSNPTEYKLLPNVTYLHQNGTREDSAEFEGSGTKGTLIGGKTAYTLKDAKEKGIINDTDYEGYCNAIVNSAIKSSNVVNNGENLAPEDFYIYQDDNGKIHFALIADVEDGSGAAVTYDFSANGAYTKNKEYDHSQLEFDPATGRIKAITIPTTYGEDGKPLTFTTIDLTAETVTDEIAYQDAYAQYEYEQYLYDKKQQEINAKTEILQQEDRNLELKLQRLDNERTQIKTEIEAVEKVINDNIEASYKTFSG